MDPELDDDGARDLLVHLVAPVTAAPLPLVEIGREAARRGVRRRRVRAALLATAAAVVVAGAVTALALRDPRPVPVLASDPTPSSTASATTGPLTGTRDPAGVLGRLQGRWTLRLTNIAPDGLHHDDDLTASRVTVSFRDDVLSTSDGVHAIVAHVLADTLDADLAADLTVYDIRTASATADPDGTPTPPPILETLRAIAHVSFQGDEVMLAAANYGIIAVLSRGT